jgi:hypothetical protein
LIRAWAPPFDPSVVVAEASEIVKAYGVAAVMEDNYAGEWPVKRSGIAALPMSEPRKTSQSFTSLWFLPLTANRLNCWTIAS